LITSFQTTRGDWDEPFFEEDVHERGCTSHRPAQARLTSKVINSCAVGDVRDHYVESLLSSKSQAVITGAEGLKLV